jgi:hypothetical protein
MITIPIDFEQFKESLKYHLEIGNIDNLDYVEWLDWIKEHEKEAI